MAEQRTVLVMGASGFLGSHVTRKLVERGDRVRVLLRTTSATRGLDDLDVDRHYGDIFDAAAVRSAMQDCAAVFYCVVDTRAWLRDPAPLFSTNVDGLRCVLDIAVASGLQKFVFTSTIGAVALGEADRPATEDDPFNWSGVGGPYVESRRQAEALVLEYARERGLPAVAMCVSNTYGPRDWQPTPHGAMIAAVARGRVPVYIDGVGSEVVGVEDAAEALVLAAVHGRVGQRYIVSERYLSQRELFTTAAQAVGVRPPRIGLPIQVLYAVGATGELLGRVLRRDTPVTLTSVRLLDHTSPLDHSKATRELGWRPSPATESIARAAEFYLQRPRG
ncbi:NAD-dependent epimerase/dehydratase family protein [Mycobacterium sp. MBM]|nr:NAD-dependent epimerase/dehydratase family protein [Mycobacterium sp. MBM]